MPDHTSPTPDTPTPAPLPHGVARLTHYGVIRAQGADAATFLHGQLTQDFALLGHDEARLAAFCSAKGRMQASFIGLKHAPDDIWLLCPMDVLAPTRKRLQMFVLRAKVKLSDATAQTVVYGAVGDAVPADLSTSASWSRHEATPWHWVRLPDAEQLPRALAIACTDPGEDLPAPAGPALAADWWHWLDVRSGVGSVGAAVADHLVPQMLNYESVGGVNFKKGCYPGQEVVARSQYRGILKRRAYLAHSVTPLNAGDEVFHASDREQPCGIEVSAAAHPLGHGFDAIVSMQTSASDGQPLTLASPDGPTLQLQALPYALLADI